ncbi:MAG TPA: Uma2 family endonuclease [Acidimicrobiales bacterium]|nr:Uma2 family endonuclease [Acidimicrobiales bacterium]
MTTTLSNAFTVADLEAMPDDGKRYELIGGAIVMTPAPEPVHQREAQGLFRLLEDACPPGHEVFLSPIDFDLPAGRVEPDIIVVPDASVGEKRLSGPALLVVEIVSPGSAINDRVTKRDVYAEAGVPAYWIVDPRRGHVLALRLVDGAYEPYADSTGPVTLDWPVPVAFSVADLARPRGR